MGYRSTLVTWLGQASDRTQQLIRLPKQIPQCPALVVGAIRLPRAFVLDILPHLSRRGIFSLSALSALKAASVWHNYCEKSSSDVL